MLVFKDKNSLREHLNRLHDAKKSIGLIPTMGFLHRGHLAIMEKAYTENDLIVISIFVNPTQFDKMQDLENYPKDIDGDLKKINALFSESIVFVPSVNDLYPNKVTSEVFDFESLDKTMEGRFRHGHFQGVGTVIKILLELVNPKKAYFGEKDFQQLQITKKLASILTLPTKIVGFPTYREESGLAMSSRNKRLSKETLSEAGIIFKIIKTGAKTFKNTNASTAKEWIYEQFKPYPKFKIQYVEFSEEENLHPVETYSEDKKIRLFIAIFVDQVRLIDNVSVS